MAQISIVAVVAVARNRVIGLNGSMPWSLPSDLKRYRALTMGKPMIMGRKTLQSIGRVLDGRDTIVMTRSASLPFKGAILVGSPEEAMTAARASAQRFGSNEIVIAGGAEIYQAFLPQTNRIAMTVVEADPEGDAWFPELETAGFKRISRETLSRGAKDSVDCYFEAWERN